MAISIEQGANFYCWVLPRVRMVDLPHEIEIAPKVWATIGLPVLPGEHWERWLGEVAFRGFDTALVLTVISQQPEPGLIVNHELRQKLDNLSVGVLLQGAPRSGESFYIAGANESGVPDARHFGRTRIFYPTEGMKPLVIGRTELDRAVDLASKLETINVEGEDWRRVRRGIDALMKGSSEPTFQDARLHDFVRCLEGLILPEQGNTRKQFIHRAQTFAVANEAAREMLGQIYDIRSQVEHLHHPLDPLPGEPKENRKALLFKRARQADALARFAVRHLLESETLTAAFKTDENIDAFWHEPDGERINHWGERLDLEAVL
jgi:hypothetical protein